MEMDTVAYIEHGGALAGGSMQVDGDLTLRQTWPLSVYGGAWVHPYSFFVFSELLRLQRIDSAATKDAALASSLGVSHWMLPLCFHPPKLEKFS